MFNSAMGDPLLELTLALALHFLSSTPSVPFALTSYYV